ncbi:MAG: ATP-binding cassette domain-containing protein [Chloroflexaceae bacterium]|nr:ATP-binding cassette domain-containing protein [Chloroflexaceae bacterium]
MPTAAIEARGLVKRYGDVTAVDQVDLVVAANSIYALLGPNGAGKTTTLNILTTLTLPTAGTAQVAGFDVVKQAADVRRHIGVTFQDIVLDRDLTGRQVLDIHGQLYRLSRAERRQRIADLVALVQLEEAIDRDVKTYSGGMKRRLELARGLMTDPLILFLDEPTQGLDPQNRVGIWDYIRMLNRERGLTVLLTTHYMEEAEALAQRVGIIDNGKMVIEGSPAALSSTIGAELIRVQGIGDYLHFVDRLHSLEFVQRIDIDAPAGIIHIYVDNSNRRLVDVVNAASSNGFRVEDITVARPTLGDAFLHYTGRALRD